MGPHTQPDPVSFANYFYYLDPATDNAMLIHIDSLNTNSNKVAAVTCANFFADDRLVFQANNSATVNVWTYLGKPVFTTGVWNSNNYTTTLVLDDSFGAEISWGTYNITTYSDVKSGVYPFNLTVPYRGGQTFNFNTTQGYGFNVIVDGQSQGQINNYIFSNVTGQHSVNVTSALLKYNISASADLGSSISPSGDISVNYGGSKLFSIQNKTGFSVKHVYVNDVDKGVIANYTFSNVNANYTISVTSEPIGNASLTPTILSATPTTSTQPSNSPSPTPIIIVTSQFQTQSLAIATTAIAVIAAVFALAFKKGYIKIEAVDEEDVEEAFEGKSERGCGGGEDQARDYSI
jgi:hypothetical protein